MGLVLLSHLPSIGLFRLNRHILLYLTFWFVCLFVCYFFIIIGYCSDYLDMSDRVIDVYKRQVMGWCRFFLLQSWDSGMVGVFFWSNSIYFLVIWINSALVLGIVWLECPLVSYSGPSSSNYGHLHCFRVKNLGPSRRGVSPVKRHYRFFVPNWKLVNIRLLSW